jgi:hypothetical protein
MIAVLGTLTGSMLSGAETLSTFRFLSDCKPNQCKSPMKNSQVGLPFSFLIFQIILNEFANFENEISKLNNVNHENIFTKDYKEEIPKKVKAINEIQNSEIFKTKQRKEKYLENKEADTAKTIKKYDNFLKTDRKEAEKSIGNE